MEPILKKSTNVFKTNGYVKENGLKIEPCDIKLKDENGNDAGSTKGERVTGRVSIKNENGTMTYEVYSQNLRPNGEENGMYSMYKDMTEWDTSTLVHIEGAISPNDFVNKQNKVVSNLRWSVNRGNTRSADADNLTTQLVVSGMVTKIVPEMKNDEETGRLSVELMAATGQGTCFPVPFFVDEDFADAFQEQVNVNDTIEAAFIVNSKLIGQAPQKRTMVAKKNFKEMSNESYVIELIFAEGSIIEEPEEVYDDDGNLMETNSLWINPKVMRKAMNERVNYLENLPKTQKATVKTGVKTANNFKERKKAAEKLPNFTSPIDDDDLGF